MVMEYRKFGDTYVVRMDKGEEILEPVKALAMAEDIRLASVQALGAVNDITVGVFDTVRKEYHANHFQGTFEIVSLTGTIDTTQPEGSCLFTAGEDQFTITSTGYLLTDSNSYRFLSPEAEEVWQQLTALLAS